MPTALRTVLILAVFILLGSADQVLAWGPATHVGLASTILDRLALLPAGIAAILGRHAIAYLYGNIAADMVFAKKWSRVKQSCHHWSTAFQLLDRARDDRARAFAYGYLSHLAADTVAHGKFIPRQIIVSECSVNLGHFYWELRTDAAQPRAVWTLIEQVVRQDHSDHHDALQQHLTDTFLSYEMNLLVFERMNALTLGQGFRRTMSLWHRFSRLDLPVHLMEGYKDECLDRVHSILAKGLHSPVLREDPNGTSAMMHVRVRRREVRRMKRGGLPVERRRDEVSRYLGPKPGPPVDFAAVGTSTSPRQSVRNVAICR